MSKGKMTLFIYSDKGGFVLTDGSQSIHFATEAEAANEAVRMAQELGALYTIHYCRPA